MIKLKTIRKWPRELRWRLTTRHSLARHVSGRLDLENARWLFLLGVNNSGTTVMSRLIGSHPEISDMASEGQHVTRVFPLGWKLGVPRVWTERLDLFRWTEEDDGTQALRACYDWSYYLKPNRYLFEKSPPDMIRSRWLQKNFAPARFVGAVRHPYAVCEGIRRREGYSIERAARHWKVANEIMLEDAERLDQFTLVRYEDFCTQTLSVMEGIRTFLELSTPYDPGVVEQEFSIHNASNATQAICNLNRDSFRRLSSDDVERINDVAGETMQKFGYQVESLCSFSAER